MTYKKKKFTDKGKAILSGKPKTMTELMEDTESRKNLKPETHKTGNMAPPIEVKKTFHIEEELNEKLRSLAFQNRTSEKSIVNEALRDFLEKNKDLTLKL